MKKGNDFEDKLKEATRMLPDVSGSLENKLSAATGEIEMNEMMEEMMYYPEQDNAADGPQVYSSVPSSISDYIEVDEETFKCQPSLRQGDKRELSNQIRNYARVNDYDMAVVVFHGDAPGHYGVTEITGLGASIRIYQVTAQFYRKK